MLLKNCSNEPAAGPSFETVGCGSFLWSLCDGSVSMRTTSIALLLMVSISPYAQAQNKTGKGAALGGVAGAVVGGVIGHQSRDTAEGALIGGAVGAIAGGVIGHAKDEQYAREQRYHQQMYHQQQMQQHQYRVAEQTRRAVSISDVITMTRNGIGESVIVGHIEANGVQRRPEVSDVINLHQQGVSEYVISAMQRAHVAGTTYSYPSNTVYSSRPYSQPRVYSHETVIVHEPMPTYVAPPVSYPSRTYYYPTYSPPRRGF